MSFSRIVLVPLRARSEEGFHRRCGWWRRRLTEYSPRGSRLEMAVLANSPASLLASPRDSTAFRTKTDIRLPCVFDHRAEEHTSYHKTRRKNVATVSFVRRTPV